MREMNFDTIMLACAARELEDRAIGARVERIGQPTAFTTQWTLLTRGEDDDDARGAIGGAMENRRYPERRQHEISGRFTHNIMAEGDNPS